jgi:hypothetical protein
MHVLKSRYLNQMAAFSHAICYKTVLQMAGRILTVLQLTAAMSNQDAPVMSSNSSHSHYDSLPWAG